ncbi:hypothetical protein K469DRAFT_794023 [Zopfia rhizophila CBS 207.26]|uniref:Uncharacterized protein n=1 Tax=Zopfia rhizophila CBS 207.26 TaxID=1314779 RepID=A0A6A6D867_9PEZI|nr:hypothetical protein K469DRAFT_794023 [Zopfia rhizophila CBS 207.26]
MTFEAPVPFDVDALIRSVEAYWATDPSRSPVDRKIPIRDLLKHGRQSQESKRAHFQSELVARPFHRDGQQHPPPTNPEVPSFQSHLPRNLRRRPPQPTMKQPQQTIPRARTCSGRSHMPSATKRKRADIPNRAPKKRRSARPDENACDEWMEHIRNHDPGHGLASLMSFERVTSFRLAAAVLSKETVERCISLPSLTCGYLSDKLG